MTGRQSEEITRRWQDPAFARSWVRADGSADLLELPRRMAAAIVADDRPAPALVVDIASGPGAFLATFLEEFPSARGVWSDASDAMLAEARRTLEPFGDRVEFRVGDMTDLANLGLPSEVDVVLTSRAAHHLEVDELERFYAASAGLLVPGGWLVDLDHVGPPDVWDRRLRAVRRRFVPTRGDGAQHHHNYPLTSVGDHLAAFAAAGIDDVEVVWRAFYTCLFMGRTPGPPAKGNADG